MFQELYSFLVYLLGGFYLTHYYNEFSIDLINAIFSLIQGYFLSNLNLLTEKGLFNFHFNFFSCCILNNIYMSFFMIMNIFILNDYFKLII